MPAKLQFFSSLEPLQDGLRFPRYLAPLKERDWVVYAKPPFAGPEQVLDYVGRYTHRVAISNNRLLDIEDGQVRFKWKDYRGRDQVKTMTLAAEEFIRRFLLHVLPEGFQRIRYYGFLGNRHREEKLAVAATCSACRFPSRAGNTEADRRLPRPLRRTHRPFAPQCPGLPPRADDHHRNDRRRHDKAAVPGHVMMATHFRPLRYGIDLPGTISHGDRFVALPFRKPAIEPQSSNAPPKHGVDQVRAPSPTRLPRYPTALSSSHSDSAPFNAHSSTAWGRLSPTRF